MADRQEWKPNRLQAQFLALPWAIKEGLYGGGAGSGKSDVLLIYPLAHKLHENSKFKQVFMRRTFPELRNEIVPRSRELYLRFGANFNRSEMTWTFPRLDQYGTGVGGSSNSGALIFLGHCENEDDVHKYDSMEINLFTPDEITSITEYIYLYIAFTRVRTSDPTLPAIIRAAGMPGGIGHSWTKRRFIDPYKQGGKIIVGKGNNKRIYIHATLADNPHIDKTYGQSLEALSEAEKKAKKFGDWDAYLGLVFDEFRDRPYPDEPKNACHVVEPFEIPSYWPKFVIGDWGFAAQTYIGYFAVSPLGKLFQYREQSFRKTKIEEWAPFVKEYIESENPEFVRFCKSAGQDRGQEQTIQQQLETALGCTVELTNNSAGSRISGKILIHEYLRWKSKHVPIHELPEYNEEHAQWLIRIKGIEAYKAYLSIFELSEPETNIPRLQLMVCDKEHHIGHELCCPLMVDAIKACNYAKPKNNKPAEDVMEWDGDDPYDVLRYACDAAERYFDESSDRFAKVVKQAELNEKLSETKDWTAYYRNMRHLESESEDDGPIKRFHSRSH